MATVPHPRPPAHPLARVCAPLEETWVDWRITVEGGHLVARHRHESYDAHREMWGLIATTVWADTPEALCIALEQQQVHRWAEVAR